MAAVLGGHGLERKGIFAGHGGGMGRKPVHLYFERRHGHAVHHRNPGTRTAVLAPQLRFCPRALSCQVGRGVIDGILDAYEYASTHPTSMQNVDEIISSFCSCCAQVSSTCTLYAPDADSVRERIRTILADLKRSPMPVPFGPLGPHGDHRTPAPPRAVQSNVPACSAIPRHRKHPCRR